MRECLTVLGRPDARKAIGKKGLKRGVRGGKRGKNAPCARKVASKIILVQRRTLQLCEHGLSRWKRSPWSYVSLASQGALFNLERPRGIICIYRDRVLFLAREMLPFFFQNSRGWALHFQMNTFEVPAAVDVRGHGIFSRGTGIICISRDRVLFLAREMPPLFFQYLDGLSINERITPFESAALMPV